MAKVKKAVSDEKKIKKRSVLSTTVKDKTPKNRRKNLGAISSKPGKTLKKSIVVNNTDSVKATGKKKLNSLKKQHTKNVKATHLLKNSESKKEILLMNNRSGKSKQNLSPQIQKDNKSPKTKTKASNIQNKFTPKIKKTTIFKHKMQKFKVKTDLIFNQKPKKIDDNNIVNLEENSVRSGIKALFKVIEESKNDKQLFEDDIPIFVQFSSIKVGKTPSRTLRIPLKHSLLKDTSEICLITEDAKGFPKKEFEKTIEHYENLLQENNISNIKTIMPFYQLKTEYGQFELLRKLVELYDMFIVDAKLSGYVAKKLGKIFYNKRKFPIPVRLGAKHLKENIEFALSKTSTNLHPHGDNFTIQIAHSDMPEQEIYENFEEVCKSLAQQFPGGWSNIRSLHLKTPKSMGIPVYYSLKNASEVPVPVAKAKRPKAYKEVTGELSTTDDKEVTVLPSGKVTIRTVDEPQQQSKKNKKTNTKKIKKQKLKK